ncbi:MAG: hypothetical protein QF724_06570 [Planctomycetota bacterium]|nr:hypothetical protein [Planctomycetota bacterium]MDP6368527.1 hypothetical protein [Planctomycetota bacterium]MDP6838584.1 hypothetical protein [Planctomycetota bacterium]MDP6957082.1 hypothetical protein [Planctomycetota bacterium]
MRRAGLSVLALVLALVIWRLAPGGSPEREALPVAPPVLESEVSQRTPALPELPPGPWLEWNNQALLALERGENGRAVDYLEQALAALPGDGVLEANLAEALARLARQLHREDGATAEVLGYLERAVGLDSRRDDLAQLLARWRAEAELEDGFRLDETDHFEFRYDGERRALLAGGVHDLSQQLEAAYQELGVFFGLFPVEEGGGKIRVVLYRRGEFGAVAGLGDWVAGLFDGTVRLAVEDLAGERRRLGETLRHELVHAFTHRVGGGRLPGWLDEGLAQWLEANGGRRPAALARARQTLAGGQPHPWELLAGSLATWTDGEQVARAYAQSLLLVDLLVRQYGERLILGLVEGCGAGRTPEETFRERLQLDLWETVAVLGL